MSAELSILILAVESVERAVAFYRAAFDWPVAVEVPVYVELRISARLSLGLYERTAFAANVGRIPEAPPSAAALTSTELYLTVDDLDAALERLEAAGARMLSPRAARPWGDEAAYVADPDGNVVVVAARRGTDPES